MNLAILLEMAAEGDPERIVVGDAEGGLRAGELLTQSIRAAKFFARSQASNIAYFGLNADTIPVALFGAALAGIPFVPLNYRSTDEQISSILPRIAPALVLADPPEIDRLRRCGAQDIVALDEFLPALLADQGDEELPFVDPGDVAILLFTSGTTGEPKAAVLRHHHLASYVVSSVEFMGSEPIEAQLVSVPPYHIAGISAVLSSLYGGRRLVYLPSFEPEAWVHAAIDQAVTHAMVVPTMLGRILKVLEQLDLELPSLRHLSYGGGRMPVDLIERTMAKLAHVDLVNAYGLTETSSTIALLSPADHREAFASPVELVRARLTSVGRPLASVEVEVRDADGKTLPPGAKGEICVRGDQVAGEYVGWSGLTEDGWFRTRDAGYLDQDGYLYVEGRLDDVIVRGAENISPGEIEDVLLLHPAVAEAAVVGVPDPEWGEAVAAVVVLAEGTDASESELQDWVRQRLRSTKMPCAVHFRLELPYNPTGKLLRRVLREELAELNAS
jgi:acyl-CoA synthetase (AMP-forming)/AMP-acid ligase II